MDHPSIWQLPENAPPHFSPLSGDLETDALVIGGGMCGVLTAHELKERGLTVTVIEAGEFGQSVTAHTTAKITAQHGFLYRSLLSGTGEKEARRYAAAARRAVERLAALAQEMPGCDFERLDSYVYVREKENVSLAREETEAARELGFPAELTTETGLPFPVAGAVRFPDQAAFHPLKFLYAAIDRLSGAGVRFYSHTRALHPEKRGWRDGVVHTGNGSIRARVILVCTHFPFMDKPGWYFARVWQQRSYVLALKDAPPLDGMYIGYDQEENPYSFRPYRDMLLLGGRGHKTGHEGKHNHFERLRQAAGSFYPGASPLLEWSAQDCMTHDRIPYIGAYKQLSDRVFVATGFNKWGMSSSMTAAELLADAAVGTENPYASAFSPERFDPWLKGKSFVLQSADMLADYIGGYMKLPEGTAREIVPGEGRIVEHDGERVGAYRDEEGTLYTVKPFCTHLGCPLRWNADEKSWDCPCHGSRYDITGHIINNPAVEPLRPGRSPRKEERGISP
ncbi:MAG: FAD-dependent oxidoreductase [Clostridiales bacterium]|nr:FAD-dependent oxidoreductase [Clostridiales bacterium]